MEVSIFLRHLIWVSTVCQLPFLGSLDLNVLNQKKKKKTKKKKKNNNNNKKKQKKQQQKKNKQQTNKKTWSDIIYYKFIHGIHYIS